MAYEYWRDAAAQSDLSLPHIADYRPYDAVPQALDHSAMIDVGANDASDFRALETGSETIGLLGFEETRPERQVWDRIHLTLLVDLLWVKMDHQAAYIESEIIVDELTVRFVHLMLPLFTGDDIAGRVHIVTRPVIGTKVALEAFL